MNITTADECAVKVQCSAFEVVDSLTVAVLFRSGHPCTDGQRTGIGDVLNASEQVVSDNRFNLVEQVNTVVEDASVFPHVLQTGCDGLREFDTACVVVIEDRLVDYLNTFVAQIYHLAVVEQVDSVIVSQVSREYQFALTIVTCCASEVDESLAALSDTIVVVQHLYIVNQFVGNYEFTHSLYVEEHVLVLVELSLVTVVRLQVLQQVFAVRSLDDAAAAYAEVVELDVSRQIAGL